VLKFGVFLSIAVGVVDKIKKKRLIDEKIVCRHKRYYGKNTKKHAYYIYMERNFVNFFIVKKNWNFRPIILGNMDI
jgi:intergrase/recombinase